MAQQIKITMKEDNGTDFDTLYPQTVSNQVVMQDDTGALTDKTLDDKVNEITTDGGTFQIGDTLTTARTNLGDKWLLCNGGTANRTEYSELSNLISPNIELSYCSNMKLLQTYNTLSRVYTWSYSGSALSKAAAFYDGNNFVYIANGNVYVSGRTYYSALFSKINNIRNQETNVDNAVEGYRNNNAMNAVKVNGYFVSNYGYSTYYFSDVNNLNANSNLGHAGGFDVKYFNGKYYACVPYTSSSMLSGLNVLNDLSDTSPTRINEPSTMSQNISYRAAQRISICDDELYVSISTLQDSSGNTSLAKLYRLSNNVLVDVAIPESRVDYSMSLLVHFGNYYYLNLGVSIYRCSDISNPSWERIRDCVNTSPTLKSYTNNVMYKTADKLIFYDGYYVDYSGNLSTSSLIESGTITNIDTKDGNYLMARRYLDGNTIKCDVYEYALTSFVLPTISVADNLYTYIKAKS